MSRGRKANPALIGAFVLGAAALTIGAVGVFGSGSLFRKAQRYVCYFSGSVNGLNIGAPVKFRGVTLGAVTDIRLQLAEVPLDVMQGEIRIPVYIEIDETLVAELGGRAVGVDRERLDRLIEAGLRARLQTESFVTGVLYVGLDYTPGSPVILNLPKDSGILEMPTLPTTLEQAFQTFTHIMHRLNGLDIEGLLTSARDAFASVDTLARSSKIEETLTTLDQALAAVRDAAQAVAPKVGPALGDVNEVADQATRTLERLDTTLRRFETVLDPSAPVVVELTRTLTELGEAARSVRELVDYLNQKPNAILTGRPES